ncbi:MAG: GH92 family glycosyl hydrolase [Prevotella sp.]|nr:GH92 family glycosyl hydrolase [Prevotella sp.]
MNRLRLFLLLGLVCLIAGPIYAQYERLGGVYYAYPVTETTLAAAPEGYEPFYISHYGRHGSRWLPNDERYIWVNKQFEDKNRLTKLGKNVRKRLGKIWKNAKGNGGLLTPLGGRQHHQIARRMYQNFPQLFTAEAHLSAHSSTVNRCKTSMENFVSELKTQNPLIHIDPITREEDMSWIAYKSQEQRDFEHSKSWPLPISTDRFINALFTDASHLSKADREKLLSELHTIASDMQDVELKVSLYDIFTEEELLTVYNLNNRRMTLHNGDEIGNNGIAGRCAVSLWNRVEADADAAIAKGGVGVDLRFGHDTNFYRLMTLMGFDTKGMPMDVLLPMAANLQMIFYRNAQGRVLVQLLHNEQPARLNSEYVPVVQGFYDWEELKRLIADRIHYFEHLRQLCALNTMVGTAPANTKTAGLFGKGSEEHGQTLPAVLSPNGQNAWTPQTRDTEKKCVAPYYYTDSLFQGIRNSHWIVGGCTQDYGSFTMAALGGKLRLRPEERATPFNHQEETSHPHYYAVRLPQEHLKVEMTATSHAAIFRITPEEDGPVHIVLNHNSDEREGCLKINPQDKTIYGYNPVHRIYQGWGEPAGFSGHFFLKVCDTTGSLAAEGKPEIVDSGCDSLCAWFTFKGKAHQPIILKAATSFTSQNDCLRNFAVEAESLDFDSMMNHLAQQWIARLHSIDVEDPDTARVNQFYGALYRASFLPREMSDASGRYPKFADGSIAGPKAERPRKYYGDFSMWDTYRALHPLYHIIAPKESADMMQSLVTMYEDGGWWPVFPCWNSYTAAMIGDHCSVALADAYLKGIRDFDVEKAYEGMRKNAFQTPDSYEEYKNGMGRRALESYLKYGYIPLEDSVKEAYHREEQTSRTLEYAFDDFAVALLAKALGRDQDYKELMRRSESWRNVINPKTGYCDGRHAPRQISRKKNDGGRFEDNTDFIHRKPWITEGAACHYTWYVPHNIEGLIDVLGGPQKFEAKLDSMFAEGRYWHGNEPSHQIAYLYDFIGKREKTIQRVAHILDTEYNDTAGGLSGNDDAGQISAWYIFSSLGFYPVCPASDRYMLSAPRFQKLTLNLHNGRQFTITPSSFPSDRNYITHQEIMSAK